MTTMQQLRDRTSAIIDQRFAELVRLSFMAGAALDAERPAMEISAVLRTGQGQNRNLAGTVAEQWKSRVAFEGAQLHIDRATYTGPMLRKGDKVRALSRPGQPLFEVLRDPDDRHHRRLVLELGDA